MMKSHAIRLFPLLPLLVGSALAGSIADFGARTSEPDPVQARLLHLPPDSGHMITEVFPDSPAARLGLAKGDLVLAINGTPPKNIVSLAEVVATNHEPRQEIEVSWDRAGRKSSAKVKLGEGCDSQVFTERYQKEAAEGRNRYVDLSRGTTSFIEPEATVMVTPREGGKRKVKVIRLMGKEVVFKDEITEDELDKVPEAYRDAVRDKLQLVRDGIMVAPAPARQAPGEPTGNPQQSEHDMSELLKKLEGNKPGGK